MPTPLLLVTIPVIRGVLQGFLRSWEALFCSQFVVEDGPEHSSHDPSSQARAGPHTAHGVGVAEVAAAAGDVPVAHVEILVGWGT